MTMVKSLLSLSNDFGRQTCDNCVRGKILIHHTIRAYHNPFSDTASRHNHRTGADENIISNCHPFVKRALIHDPNISGFKISAAPEDCNAWTDTHRVSDSHVPDTRRNMIKTTDCTIMPDRYMPALCLNHRKGLNYCSFAEGDLLRKLDSCLCTELRAVL